MHRTLVLKAPYGGRRCRRGSESERGRAAPQGRNFEGALRKLRQIQEYVILKSRQDDAVVALVKFATPFYMGRWVDDGCNTCSTPICNALASVAEGASVVEGLGRA